LKYLMTKGSIGHTFVVCIHTENQNQGGFYPFVLLEISGLNEPPLGHLRYLLTDVPPQPNSPPDNVFNPGHGTNPFNTRSCSSPSKQTFRKRPTHPTLRANPYPEVTDLFCRLPLSTLFYQLEAVNLGDLLRLWVRLGTLTRRSVHPASPVLLTKNGPLEDLIQIQSS
ncbi:unnamed protein product, partial [Sphagnum tenellum]